MTVQKCWNVNASAPQEKLIAEERDLSNYRTRAYVNDIRKQLQTQSFSFQQSCINQIMTESIGIHLKREN